ncbi:probable cationic amino acid transporter [Microtus ochrogaster]|uniref:Probable cationic amino acid transporter n=1 Tax=Microtus ochrogaster TaxID=79684 RepID=A0ABM1AYT4_MICOH|nr:probable cationic amino acid transporter [Microtus ochrogaster]
MSGFLASVDPRRVQWGAAWYAMHSRILRTKPVESMLEGTGTTTAHGTKLAQVLTTVDLISLGVGSCVGTGMYVVSGLVAKEMAGPGVIVSFIIAAVASILSGVCYAEFGVRVPKTTGSAYTYSYVTVGEFVAFFIGWNLILEYLIGTAAGASALSSMFDSLANHTISRWMVDTVGTCHPVGKGEESYPDLLALVIAVIVTVIVALGVKNSVGFNNVLNVLNLAVWVFIMIAGFFFVNGKYWAEGQFLPHGWSGVLQGAATCFYAFIGFDIIATTGEEAKNPNTSIPYAITASLVICLTAYVTGQCARSGLSAKQLRFLAHVSSYTETPVVACIVSGFLAALLSLLVSLRDLIEMMSIGTLLAYTLVSVCVLLLRYQPESDIDGFVKFLSEEHTKKKEGILADCEKETCSPVSEGEEFSSTATNTCGAKNLPSLGDNEMLIGKSDKSTYNVSHPNYGTVDMTTGIEADESENIYLIKLKKLIGPRYYTMRIRLGLPGKMDRPTAATGHTVTICVLLLFILMFIFCSFIIFGSDYISGRSWWAILLVVLMVLLISVLVFVILQQPENPKKLPYMAPCLPFVPAFAMLVNIYLMLKLSTITWIRFAVWCFVGLLIYFGYGIWNSTLEISAREQALHQSMYQRYDVDDPFSVEEGFSYATEGESQEDWGGPAEDKGFYYQQMSEAKTNARTSSKAKSKSKHKQNSEALIANDELDYSPE